MLHQLHNPTPPYKTPSTSDIDYHLAFNHTQPQTLDEMAKRNLHPALPSTLKSTPPQLSCSGCASGKQKPTPFHRTTRHNPVGSSLTSDICGPLVPISRYGNKYFHTFLDIGSRYLIVDYMPSRQNLPHRISSILTSIKANSGHTPRLYRTDNAKEYLSRQAITIYAIQNVQHTTSLPCTPQQNSLAERINHTLVSSIRAALYHGRLPLEFWEDALRDIAFKYNHIVHNATGNIPYNLWFDQKPPRMTFFVFGQLGTIPQPDRQSLQKLQPRSIPVRYLYPNTNTTIIFLNLRTHKNQQTRAIDFCPYDSTKDPLATASTTYKATTNISHALKAFVPHPIPQHISLTTPAPLDHTQARKYPDAQLWSKAHNDELDSLDNRHIIQWLPSHKLPPNTKLLPLTMTYRYKRDSDNGIVKRKARCALRGDKMLPHIHYDPDKITTYMSDKTTVRLIFAIAAAYQLHLEHWDIESACLHEKYEHNPPVYVKQFARFDGSFKHPHQAGLLVGNLYGDKEAGFIYLTAAARFLRSLHYHQYEAEPCIFYRSSGNNITFLNINIDDIIIASTHASANQTAFAELSRKYKLKCLGFPGQYLGWKVTRLLSGAIHLSQPPSISKIPGKTNLTDANPKRTPYLDNAELYPTNPQDKPAPIPIRVYQQLLGNLRYIVDSTRPDIFFVVNRLTASAHHPSLRHWNALKRLLRYLKGTVNHGITYHPISKPHNHLLDHTPLVEIETYFLRTKPSKITSDTRLESYSDADYAASPDDRKSITPLHIDNQSALQRNEEKTSTSDTITYVIKSRNREFKLYTHPLQRCSLTSSPKHCVPSLSSISAQNYESLVVLLRNQTPRCYGGRCESKMNLM